MAGADRRRLRLALAIIAGFMAVEVVAGIVADSVALLSDAAHMVTDAGGIALALAAARLAARPPSRGFTYGFKRAEILSAQLNGASLLVLAGIIAFDSVGRLREPHEVDGGIVIVVGVLGALVNVAAGLVLARADRRSLNVEGALQHVLADLYGSIATVASGVAVAVAGFERADPIAALVVVGLMLRSGWGLVRDSGRVLLEAVPAHLDEEQIGEALREHPGVVGVHDLHVWELTSGFPALSAHVLVRAGDDLRARRTRIEAVLQERFGIEHTTLQVDHAPA